MTTSFNILADEYRPMLLAYIRSMVQDAHLAEDLAQDTFVAAYASLDKFKDGGNFGKWLRGIARNKVLMHWRRARRRPLLVDSRVVDGIDDVFESMDRNGEEGVWWDLRKRALQACIEKLSDHLKAAIQHVYFGEQSLAEAALSLDSSRAAVAQRVSRARTQIRSCVELKITSGEPDV